MSATIQVRHNIEVAHRLSQLPGKCENIHGHSMWVELELAGDVDSNGILEGLDFGAVKQAFRGHLDSKYDHHLLLNENDPIAELGLPGLRTLPGDPTTELIAQWVGHWAALEFPYPQIVGGLVTVRETHVNAATYRWTA